MNATQTTQANGSASVKVLYMAIELASKSWLLGFSATLAGKPRRRSVEPYGEALLEEVRKAKQRFELGQDAPVVCCLEAGRDAFAPVRWLRARGIEAIVIDASSVDVDRRKRRAKTDRIDVELLLNRLIRHHNGEPKVFRAVRQPTEAQEDDRRPHRELERLTKERTQHRSRMKALLATIGVAVKLDRHFPELVDEVRQPHGAPLPPNLRRELLREWARLQLCEEQMSELRAQFAKEEKERQDIVGEQTRQLKQVKGVGTHSARVLATEMFSWRELRSAKQVGAIAGLAPAPWQTGQQDRDQGISKSGSPLVRKLMVQLAWGWLRYQPDSALSKWFWDKYGDGRRMRKIGIVALARKLLVDLWRLVQYGVVPDGAIVAAA